MRFSFIAVAAILALTTPGLAKRDHKKHGFHGHKKLSPMGVESGDTTIYNATFDQLLDHDNPHLGTFKQTYWYSTQFWKGPGSPVVFFNPGETAAAGYMGFLTNRTINGLYAAEIGGAVILIEHRYWGYSSPFESLTTENLQYLNLKNSIADLTYFARNAKLPFDTTGRSNAPAAPWVLTGGSYSGALAAWTASTAPGTFWAYHASSAPVEAIFDYWQYFYPVQQGLPANCSKDVSLVVDHVDSVLSTGTPAEKTELKSMFGLEGVVHDDDFASVLLNGPWAWQEVGFTTGYSTVYQFCDSVEGAVGHNFSTPSAAGVGLTKALAGYASWVNSSFIPGYCQQYGSPDLSEYDVSCFDSYNAQNPMFTDLTVGNIYNRQWNWFLCNEPFAYWQDGAPAGTSTIASRLVNGAYWQRQCELFFPTTNGKTYGSSPTAKPELSVATVNAYTSGWDLPLKATANTRVLYTNGEFDPWRTSGVSSQFRDGGEWKGSEFAPVQVIPNGVHCSDLDARNGAVNAGVQAVIDQEVKQIYDWIQEFYHH